MATWVRQGTGTAPTATDADLIGNYALDNATAPGDFDTAGVTSVRAQWTITGSGFTDDSWNNVAGVALVTGATEISQHPAEGSTGNQNVARSSDNTDSTGIPTGLSVAEWEAALVRGDGVSDAWCLWVKVKGADGSTLAVSALTITITYTPAAVNRTGSGTPTEANDTSAGTGSFTPPQFTGSGTPTEQNDTSAGTGVFVGGDVTGSGTPTEADDTSAGTGNFVPNPTGSGTPTEANDTSTGVGTFTPSAFTGSGTPTEADDTSSGVGSFTPPTYTGVGTPSEEADTATGTGTFTTGDVTGSGAPVELNDISVGVGSFDSGQVLLQVTGAVLFPTAAGSVATLPTAQSTILTPSAEGGSE